jgi:hypothetical protein
LKGTQGSCAWLIDPRPSAAHFTLRHGILVMLLTPTNGQEQYQQRRRASTANE